MVSCIECVHVEVCNSRCPDPNNERLICEQFKDRSRFVELPFSISEGTKLYYIFEEIDGKIVVGKNRTTVTQVCKDGFYVSGRIHSDGTYQQDDEFYLWSAIGNDYFLTRKEAEMALKECGNCG